MKKEVNSVTAIILGVVALAVIIGLGVYFLNPRPVLRADVEARTAGGGAAQGKAAPQTRPKASAD